jgi:ATP-dependent Clp protease ATP-binding subunit ClpA
MTDIAEYLKARLVDVFKPELLNRFSKIIIFKNLEPKDLPAIVAINLAELIEAAKAQKVSLEFTPEAAAKIAKLGYDPAFGARPLRRVIDEQIRAPLSEALLAHVIDKGGSILCAVKDDAFVFVNKDTMGTGAGTQAQASSPQTQ